MAYFFRINKAEERDLDAAEGYPNDYGKCKVTAITISGDRNVMTYLGKITDASRRPYHWYKAYVVAGATEHGLPQTYMEWLKSIDSIQDPDDVCRSEKESLLPLRCRS